MLSVNNTSPLSFFDGKRMMRLTRRFLGNPDPKNCVEGNELRAYCKGYSQFSYGRDEDGNQMYYKVRQEYFYK